MMTRIWCNQKRGPMTVTKYMVPGVPAADGVQPGLLLPDEETPAFTNSGKGDTARCTKCGSRHPHRRRD